MKSKIYVLILLPLLCGCSLLKLPTLTTPKEPKTVYNWREVVEKKPTAVVAGNKVIVVQDERKELNVSYEKIIPRRTAIQKIGSWISNLGMIGFILLIIGIILAPAATIGFLFKTLMKWKHAMKETVSALKESGIVSTDRSVKSSLAGKQSKRTKKVVDSIKVEL